MENQQKKLRPRKKLIIKKWRKIRKKWKYLRDFWRNSYQTWNHWIASRLKGLRNYLDILERDLKNKGRLGLIVDSTTLIGNGTKTKR